MDAILTEVSQAASEPGKNPNSQLAIKSAIANIQDSEEVTLLKKR